MVVNGMAVTKMAIKWKLVLELPHHIYYIFLPSSHSLLACIIRQKATTSRNHSYHIIRLLLPPLIVDNIINCFLYGICIPHLNLPKMILYLITWDHGITVYSLLYYITGKSTLLPELNQTFQVTETIINNFIPTSVKISLHRMQQ